MSPKTEQPQISELSVKDLDALIKRAQDAIDTEMALSPDDIRLLLSAVVTLATMQERLSNKDVTLHKLRKLLGMVQSSEKLRHLMTNDNTAAKKPKVVRKPKPTTKKIPPPTKVFHQLDTLKKGDSCPECKTGKLYKFAPAEMLRIVGNDPFEAQQHISERLRCNACGAYFTAPLPDEVTADGEVGQKYGYSARALMVLSKYFGGTPFYRQESLQDMIGLSITASTIFDQTEYVANALQPVLNALKALAANASHFYLDDTTNRILDQTSIEKPVRNNQNNKTKIRTGLYTSGLIATIDSEQGEHHIVLFQTDIGHAGEFIDDILKQRRPDKPPPLLMSDALSSNNATVVETEQAACNAHGRRQFVDVMSVYPDEVTWVLEQYQSIWANEDICVTENKTPAERLAYHKKHSLPVMTAIREWGQKHFENETVEENSSLGKAIAYFNRHFDRLTLFCSIENAKIDNNMMERMLKLIVRNRKNAHFYKTLAGAAISDVLTSCLATSMEEGINALDYLKAIQRNGEAVRHNPYAWLPWNYLQNI